MRLAGTLYALALLAGHPAWEELARVRADEAQLSAGRPAMQAQLDQKAAALRCHVSQLGDDDVVDDVVRERAAEAGRAAGVGHAEGFRRLSFS